MCRIELFFTSGNIKCNVRLYKGEDKLNLEMQKCKVVSLDQMWAS